MYETKIVIGKEPTVIYRTVMYGIMFWIYTEAARNLTIFAFIKPEQYSCIKLQAAQRFLPANKPSPPDTRTFSLHVCTESGVFEHGSLSPTTLQNTYSWGRSLYTDKYCHSLWASTGWSQGAQRLLHSIVGVMLQSLHCDRWSNGKDLNRICQHLALSPRELWLHLVQGS